MNTDYHKALKLRFHGKSYGEINNVLKIPKSTLSSWFKNLELPPSVKKILEEKGRVAREQLMKFNRRRTQFIKAENKEVREIATGEVKNLSKYEILLIGSALYWAEGYNKQEKVRSPYLSFGNADPRMVILFLRFLREIMDIPEEGFRPSVQIHKNISAEAAINFWAKTTNIPKKLFYVTHQVSRASKGKRSPHSLPHGTFRLNVRGRQNFFKVRGWIDGLIKQT